MPALGRIPRPLTERFWKFVPMVNGADACWPWLGAKKLGYGRIADSASPGARRGLQLAAHRVSYQMLKGPIPEGLELDHLCNNRACVRPDHLEPVTKSENGKRGFLRGRRFTSFAAENAAKTSCIRGHLYTPENTYRIGANGRGCIECRRLRWYTYGKAWRRKKRDQQEIGG